jgi:hypothetical protein
VVLFIESFSDYSSYLKGVLIFFIIWNFLAIAVATVRFVFYTKRNPRSEIGDKSRTLYP